MKITDVYTFSKKDIGLYVEVQQIKNTGKIQVEPYMVKITDFVSAEYDTHGWVKTEKDNVPWLSYNSNGIWLGTRITEIFEREKYPELYI